nr:MAG TPA: hypothetical protein [Caudoviricetes sp.]
MYVATKHLAPVWRVFGRIHHTGGHRLEEREKSTFIRLMVAYIRLFRLS